MSSASVTANSKAFLIKLKSIDFPNAGTFDPTDEKQFRHLISYVEDQVIRLYQVDKRSALRDTNNKQWNEAFLQYLRDLHCPLINASRISQLSWLLSRAVSLVYCDKKTDFQISAESYVNQLEIDSNLEKDPLEDINYESNGFKNFVQKLAKLLNIPDHPDHKQVFQAACILIHDKLNETSRKRAVGGSQPAPFMKMEDVPLGFKTNDPITREIAVILRLLHLKDLRDLQNVVNATIVQVQALTADPKTDEKLGKVGF